MTDQTKRRLGIAGIMLACISLDHWTKWLAIHALKGTRPHSFLGGFFVLEYSENPGAFLSLGAALSEGMRFWILTVIVTLFLVFLIIYLLRDRHMQRVPTLALALICGGGISNCIDRIFRDRGQVIDFMNMGIGSLRTGIFNIADVAIMIGTGLFLIVSRNAQSTEKT